MEDSKPLILMGKGGYNDDPETYDSVKIQTMKYLLNCHLLDELL